MEPLLLSIPDVQAALGIGRSTTYKLIDDGSLETVKIGRRTLIPVASVRRFATAQRAAK